MHSRRDFLSTGLSTGALSALGLALPLPAAAAPAVVPLAVAPAAGVAAPKFVLVDGWILTAEDVAALRLG